MRVRDNIEKFKHKDFFWLNITKKTAKEIDYLRKHFDFHPSDLRDTLPPLQRPKLIEHHDYIFLILLFPLYSKRKKTIVSSEIDFYIGPDYLITIHENDLSPIRKFTEQVRKNPGLRQTYLEQGGGRLLYEILYPLFTSTFPLLTKIGNRLDMVEKQIFAVHRRETIHQILEIKTNIVDLRKTMQSHKNVLKKIINKSPDVLPAVRFEKNKFNSLKEISIDIWDYLETFNNTIDAVHQTHESLANFRLNDIIKTLTIFSVIVFPLTLLAAIFGMNTPGIPFTDSAYGFWIVVAIMAVGTLGMFYFFRHKRWI
ncbi:MAG TPA: magnesium transporter CorA family protein [Patescibacteria group bacterium]